jgi:hypothetical protein
MGNEESKKMIQQLTKILDELDKANLFVILVNVSPYSKKCFCQYRCRRQMARGK